MDTWLSYYHPSTVVFVDDQQAFLTAIKNRLPKQTSALFFSNAQEALITIFQRPSQYQKGPICGGFPTSRSGLPMPGLPKILQGLSPSPFYGRGISGRDPDDLSQSLVL